MPRGQKSKHSHRRVQKAVLLVLGLLLGPQFHGIHAEEVVWLSGMLMSNIVEGSCSYVIGLAFSDQTVVLENVLDF